MMAGLLALRERGIRFFKEYDTWFRIGGKFIGMMLVLARISSGIGFFTALTSLPVMVLIALVCSIIPSGFVVFITAILVSAHMMKLSPVMGLLAALVMLIVYLLFLKYSSRHSLVLLAVPVLMQWNLQYMVPVIAGLIFTPYAFIPAVAGMFLTKFIGNCVKYSPENVSVQNMDYEGILAALNKIFVESFTDNSIWMYAICAAIAIAVCFFISRMSFDYSWYAGLLAGAITQVVVAYVLAAVTEFEIDSATLMAGTLLGLIAGAVIQFFRCMVDYSRKEFVQFEDEDYYYYVKAIPKFLTYTGRNEMADEKKVSDAQKAARSIKNGVGHMIKKKKDRD